MASIPALTMSPRLHPLVVRAVELYERSKKRLSSQVIGELERGLGEILDIEELRHAVGSLALLAILVEDDGDKHASAAIQTLLRSQKSRFDDWREGFVIQSADDAEKYSLDKLAGEVTKREAPRFGATRPKGTLSLSSLIPNPATQRPRPERNLAKKSA